MKRRICLLGVIVGVVCTMICGCSTSVDDNNETSHTTVNTISSSTDITENNFSDYSASEEKLMTIEHGYLNDKGFVADEDIFPLLDEVEKEILKEVEEGKVQTYNRSDNNIYIEYKGGIGYLFVPYQEDILGMGENNNIITLEPNQDDYSVGIARFETWIDKKYNNLEYQGAYSLAANAKMITDKYPDKYVYNQNPSMDYVNIFDDEYSSYANSHVTIDRLKTLNDYEVIIFEGHGGYNERINSVLFTGETFIGWKELSKYKEDIANGEIVLSSFPSIGNVSYSFTRTYGVTSKFFERHLGEMNGTIVFLGSCCSCKDRVLADTFLSKGASAVLGFDTTVTMVYEMIARSMFFFNLTNDDISVAEAFTRTVNRIGVDSDEEGAILTYFDKDNSATNHSLSGNKMENTDSEQIEISDVYDSPIFSDIIQTYKGTTYYAQTTATGGGSRTIDFSKSKYVKYSVLPISANESEQYIYNFIIYDDKVYYTISGQGSAVDSWTLKCCDLDGSNIFVLLEDVMDDFEISNGVLTIGKSPFYSDSCYYLNLSTGKSIQEKINNQESIKTVSNCGLADNPTQFDGGLYYREYTENSIEVIYYRKDINSGTIEKIGSGFQPSR